MGLKKKYKKAVKSVERQLKTTYDNKTGMYIQDVLGKKVYLRSRSEYIDPKLLSWLCDNIYFKFYRPGPTDVVVDIGAGLGHEAIHIAQQTGMAQFFAVEIQPSVYECLCQTLHEAGFGKATGVAIGESDGSLFIAPSARYEAQSTATDAGCVEVPTIAWQKYLDKYGLSEIDLLKINIEGAEKYLLPAIGNFDNVKRIIISAHDFRADDGEGEHFRTRAFVEDFLTARGYKLAPVGDGWLRDWIYAER